MPKSTPLNQLPNNVQQNSAAQNEIVNEIIQEIENNSPNNNNVRPNNTAQQIQQQQMEQQAQQQILEQQQQQIQQQQMQQQQMEQQQQQQQMQQADQENISNEIDNILSKEQVEEKSLSDTITDMLKQPVLVGVLVILFSLPQINNIIVNVLPKKAFFLNNANIFVSLLKGIFASVLFFGINKALL